jgi:hypothetical protein
MLSYSVQLTNNFSQVWAHGNLCCSIGAAYIPLMFVACARYLTKLELSCCSTARALMDVLRIVVLALALHRLFLLSLQSIAHLVQDAS